MIVAGAAVVVVSEPTCDVSLALVWGRTGGCWGSTSARWSRSPPLGRSPSIAAGPEPVPFSLSATFLCITGGSRRGKTSLRKGCAFWAWMMMPSSSGTVLKRPQRAVMGVVTSGTRRTNRVCRHVRRSTNSSNELLRTLTCACCLRLPALPSSLDGSSSRLGGRSWVSQIWCCAGASCGGA